MSKGGFLRSGAVLTVAQLFATVAQFAFHIYASSALAPEDYGSVGALMSLYMIVSLPLSTLMLQMTYSVSGLRLAGQGSRVYAFLLQRTRTLALWSTSLLILAFAAIPAFMRGLHISEAPAIALMWLVLWSGCLSKVPHGVLQGYQRFQWFALFIAGPAAARLGFAILLPNTLSWVMSAYAIAGFLEVIVGFLVIQQIDLEGDPVQPNLDETIAHLSFAFVILGQIGFALLTNMDMLIIKSFFPGIESGYYSVVVQINRGITFFPIALTYVLFPQVSRESILDQDSRALLLKSLGVTALLVLGCSLPCILAPRLLISTLFGEVYLGAVPLLRLVWLVAMPLAMVNILVHYLTATRSRVFLWAFLPMTAVQMGVLILGGGTPLRMFILMGIGGAVIVAALTWIALVRREPREVQP